MIRSFLDDALKIKEMPNNICFVTLKKYLEEKNCFELLHESVREGLENLVKFIFSTTHCFEDDKFKTEIVKCKEKRSGETILMLACKSVNLQAKTLGIILEYAEKFLTLNDLQSLIFESNGIGANALHFVIQYGSENDFRLLLEMLKKLLSPHEQKDYIRSVDSHGRTIWHFAANSKNNRQMFTTLQSRFMEFLTESEIISMLQQKNRSLNNLVHIMISVNNDTALKDFLTFTQNIFKDKDELKSYLKEKGGKEGANILHLAAKHSSYESFDEIWKLMRHVFDPIELKNLLHETDNYKFNVWHYASKNYNNKIVLTTLYDCFKEVSTEI